MAVKGLWTNVEDQILKAAVQKYGVHQWSKVASLIQKKTARQCEIRWKEYLDPTLNFQEFSKQEDERLLQLVKTLPNQWRTIAEMMGRTSQQCLERYNFLLESTRKDGADTNNVMDVNPSLETQPAKPDAEELAEDEREMIAEARARLVNTQGKKATRKVRERMLEESKRIAQLQKRRELKQAGIVTSLKKPKKKYATEIDYNADVIYEVVPPVVIYDVTKENERSLKELEDFERNIDRRGKRGYLEGKEDGDTKHDGNHKDKKPKKDNNNNKQNEQRQNIKSSDTVLLDDYKKPALKLSTPKKPESTENQSVPINKLREFLTDAFKRLPEPKNDFEIMLDDDEEEEPSLSEREQLTKDEEQGEEEEKEEEEKQVVEIEMESFDTRHIITIPPKIDSPKDELDVEYNKLIEHSQAGSVNTILATDLADWQSINEEIKATTEQEIPAHPSAMAEQPPIDPRSLFTQICNRKTRIDRIKNSLDNLVKPLIEQDEKDCNRLMHSIPEVRRNMHKYYIRYLMYLREKKAIEERKSWLQQFTK